MISRRRSSSGFAPRDLVCLAGSAVLHAGLLLAGGWILVEAAQFGVESGEGGEEGAPGMLEAEVELAAPEPPEPPPAMEEPQPAPETNPTPEPTPERIPTPEPEISEEADEPLQPAPSPTPAATPKPKPKAKPKTAPVASAKTSPSKASKPKPDGATGAGRTGAGTGSGGVRSASRAEYMRNPPPPYPAEAKRSKQEGVVRLRAVVNAAGRVDSISIVKSSGFPLLDDSALKTVRKWKFQPANIDGIKVSSTVNIPIRFQLD